MFCTNCGAQNRANVNYCENCGVQLCTAPPQHQQPTLPSAQPIIVQTRGQVVDCFQV